MRKRAGDADQPQLVRVFEIIEGAIQFTVDINTHQCDCMVWVISGIPCKQAARCILSERLDLESFVNEAYIEEKYRHTYDVCMRPIPDLIFWEDRNCPRIGPPQLKSKEVDPKLRGEISLRKERTSPKATRSSVAFPSNLAITKEVTESKVSSRS